MSSSERPTVSIVMATYDRSNIIRYSIESVRRGTFKDWELIVVGDACTDDTADVVAAVGDPRIRSMNLAKNFGEQSGPNNEGVLMARGRLLAFLNHDDLWHRDHLARSVAVLERDAEADLVFGTGLSFPTDDARPTLTGALGRDTPYRTDMFVPASLWVFRRSLSDRIGPWAPAQALRGMSSQDWLYRAHRARAVLAGSAHPAAVMIGSGSRRNAYRERQSDMHVRVAARMQTQDFDSEFDRARERMLASPPRPAPLRRRAREILMHLGVFPPWPRYWLLYWRKGSFIRSLRRRRGLSPP